MKKTQESTDKDKSFDRLKKWWKTYVGLEDYIALVLMIVGILCYFFPPVQGQNKFYDFLLDFRAEMVGTGIATLLIGNASQAAQIREEKKRLILQMGSPDNSFAIEAVRQLGQQGWLKDGSLKDANLDRANLIGAYLDEANLCGASLWEAKLNGAKLSKTNLSKVYLEGANLIGASLWDADLGNGALSWVNFSGAHMWKANFSGAHLEGANLSNVDLEGANLSGTYLYKADFSGAKLEDANLSGSFLEQANLSEANLQRANLCGTYLGRAILNETTNLAGTFYTDGDNGTVFPEGFNPADHGMHLIDEGETYQEAVKRVSHGRG